MLLCSLFSAGYPGRVQGKGGDGLSCQDNGDWQWMMLS